MANTVIALKKSSTPAAVPSSLEFGELAINYADGKLFYKNTNSQIAQISGAGGGGNYFGTVNANSVLIIADTPGDILTIEAGNNITIVGDAVNDKIIISAAPGGSADVGPAFTQANTARTHANTAYDKANTAGAYFQGNNGDVGSATGLGDIFRVHTNTLTANVTIYSGNNALAAGPITIQSGKSLTIQDNARVSIV